MTYVSHFSVSACPWVQGWVQTKIGILIDISLV